MLEVVFASLVIPAVSNFVETFTSNHVALQRVLENVIHKIGIPKKEIFEESAEKDEGDDGKALSLPVAIAILPPYLIVSSSMAGANYL